MDGIAVVTMVISRDESNVARLSDTSVKATAEVERLVEAGVASGPGAVVSDATPAGDPTGRVSSLFAGADTETVS